MYSFDLCVEVPILLAGLVFPLCWRGEASCMLEGFSSAFCWKGKADNFDKQGSSCWFSNWKLFCVVLIFISPLLSRVLQVLQAASFEAGWEKDAVFLPLSPSWQLAVVG